MKEIKTDLFETIYEDGVDAICITTNQHYTTGGLAVMGGGCAKVCADKWPETSRRLAKMLKTFGSNVPFCLGLLNEDGEYMQPDIDLIKAKEFKCMIFSFPTINNLVDGANLQLIKQSATLLKDIVDRFDLKGIMIGRPGAGIGGLDYYKEVRPELIKIFDDRFTIVCFETDEWQDISNA
jgi:hypothetical protein